MKSNVLKMAFVFVLLACTIYASAEIETYKIDPVHSSVNFKIRHIFSKVTGSFSTFEGKITVDRANMENNQVESSIDIASVNTHSEKRDGHLQSADFFNTASFPKMTFKSKTWKKVSDNEYEVTGELSFRGISKVVLLKVKSVGFGEGLQGSYVSGWEASTIILKQDFGITYGGKALGDEVEVNIEVEAQKQ